VALLKTSELSPKVMPFLERCTALRTFRPHNSVVVGSSPTRPTKLGNVHYLCTALPHKQGFRTASLSKLFGCFFVNLGKSR
jgi:hypothetical protein